MKKQNGNRLAAALILHSSFFLLHFPKLAKGEIASLAGAADDPRYFQVLADGHHAAGQLA
jgi:hypothetical protein